VLGAAVIVALPEIFRELAAYRMLVFGLMLMLLMIFRPQGILVPRAAPRPAASAGAAPAERS